MPTPTTLKIVWALAVLWASGFLEPRVANWAVTVVPIFSPSTSAIAVGKVSSPEVARAMVRPTVAEEDCTITVKMVPIETQSRMPPRVSVEKVVKKEMNWGSDLMGVSPCFITAMP